jgi:2-phospho-L-lactate/phosphoenolpyruvate guanylyltransferase
LSAVATVAILPIKSVAQAKQRLAPDFDAVVRRGLVVAMFSDALIALRRAARVDRVLVVTADRDAQQLAGTYGASIVEDDDRGHNPAASRGIEVAAQSGADRALLVPADCPMLDPRQLDELLARPTSRRCALVMPDRHGTGTNGLLLKPPDSLAPAFGPGSCERHLQNAAAAGIAAEVVSVSSLALDVDTAEDLEALREQFEVTHGGAAHTRGMLRQLVRAGS